MDPKYFNDKKSYSESTPYTIIDQDNLIEEFEANVKASKIISIDCEGEDLTRKGAISIMQIMLENKNSFIVDIQTLGSKVIPIIKEILESNSILKLSWDFRSDYDTLFHKYQIATENILDLQLVQYWEKNISEEVTTPSNLRKWFLAQVSKKYGWGALFAPSLKAEGNRYHDKSLKSWTVRPIPEENLKYSLFDVDAIFSKYNDYIRLIEKYRKLDYFLNCSLVYAKCKSDLISRTYDQWENNAIIPIYIFYSADSSSKDSELVTCIFCKNSYQIQACYNTKKCLQCFFNEKLIDYNLKKKFNKIKII